MSKVFKRKFNNTCKFLVLEDHYPIFEEVDDKTTEEDVIEQWADKKYFIPQPLEEIESPERLILVGLVDFDYKKNIILDQELYNQFEAELGLEPNTFIDCEFTIGDEKPQFEDVPFLEEHQFKMLYIFAYSDGRIFDYMHQDYYTPNKCTSIIHNILYTIGKKDFGNNMLARLAYCLTGHSERYNNCIFLEFECCC